MAVDWQLVTHPQVQYGYVRSGTRTSKLGACQDISALRHSKCHDMIMMANDIGIIFVSPNTNVGNLTKEVSRGKAIRMG